MKNISHFFFLAIFVCLCACSEEINIDDDIKQLPQVDIGLTKNQIVALHGQATEITNEIKTAGPIWGPEEEFWHKIPANTKLEIWRYKNKRAALDLYFINGSETLQYKAVHHQDLIY